MQLRMFWLGVLTVVSSLCYAQNALSLADLHNRVTEHLQQNENSLITDAGFVFFDCNVKDSTIVTVVIYSSHEPDTIRTIVSAFKSLIGQKIKRLPLRFLLPYDVLVEIQEDAILPEQKFRDGPHMLWENWPGKWIGNSFIASKYLYVVYQPRIKSKPTYIESDN